MADTYVDYDLPAASLGKDGDMHGDLRTHIWRLKEDGVWTFFADYSAIANEPAPKQTQRDQRFFSLLIDDLPPFKWRRET